MHRGRVTSLNTTNTAAFGVVVQFELRQRMSRTALDGAAGRSYYTPVDVGPGDTVTVGANTAPFRNLSLAQA